MLQLLAPADQANLINCQVTQHTHRAAHDQQQIRHKHRVSLWVLPVAYFFVWCVAMLGGYRAHALQPQVQAMLREAFGLDNHDRPATSTRQERDQT